MRGGLSSCRRRRGGRGRATDVYVGVVGGEERPLAALAGGRAEAVLTRVQLVDVVVSERLAALKTPPPPLIRTCTPARHRPARSVLRGVYTLQPLVQPVVQVQRIVQTVG